MGKRKVEPGDRGELVGLRGRADLNGKRVEVEARVVGKDGAPRFIVRIGDGGGEVVKVKAKNLRLDAAARAEPEPEEVEEISAPIPAQARASSDPLSAMLAGLGLSDAMLETIADIQRAAGPSVEALVADMRRLQQESDAPTPLGAGSGLRTFASGSGDASTRSPRRPGAGTADAHGNAPPWIYEALGRPEPRGQVLVDKSGSVALPREVTHGVEGKAFPQLDGPFAGVLPARFFQTGVDGNVTAVFAVKTTVLMSIDFVV